MSAVLSYPPVTVVPIAIATHGLVGLVLGALFFDRPSAGLVAGLAPDADFLLPAVIGWPFVHRGITHTAVTLVAVAALAAVFSNRQTLAALITAYSSHLLIDMTTPTGIPLLYPTLNDRLYLDLFVGRHAPELTVLFWVVGVSVVGTGTPTGRCKYEQCQSQAVAVSNPKDDAYKRLRRVSIER